MQTFKGYINEQKEFENLILELNDQEFDALVETLDYDEVVFLEGILGAIAKGIAKGAGAVAKFAVKKGKEKFTDKGKADAAERKAKKLETIRMEKERLQAAKEKIAQEREKIAKMKEKGADDSKLSSMRDRIKKQADSIKDKMDKLKDQGAKIRQANAK